MSAGQFSRAKYETDEGDIHPIRVQPETIIATINPEPAGEITGTVSARVSGSRRQYGILARTGRFTWDGDAPDGYKEAGVITIPILTPEAYDAIKANVKFTYLDTAAVWIGKSPERIR